MTEDSFFMDEALVPPLDLDTGASPDELVDMRAILAEAEEAASGRVESRSDKVD
ncbi:hypothetical protein F5148DRAFT_1294913 [Russula earlei]|uniref:Uncharacterized protein n=1 Tax=Russula earlei TaxID=71964 RepID=A0ACC0TS38_9AGAM|nr:hypothetical protein F5148DRAFT_1294913 [Russula earlei]